MPSIFSGSRELVQVRMLSQT